MPSNPRNTTRSNNWILRIVIGVICCGGFAIVVVMAIRIFGAVQGIEFSPDTFASRSFVYYEVPLIRMRVSGVYRQDITGTLQQKVGKPNNLIPPSTTKPPRWHLVVMNKGGSRYPDDALIAYRYLHDGGNFFMFGAPEEGAAAWWANWTDDHKDVAKIFWAAVAEVCRRELYTFTPALFFTAQQLTLPKGTKPTVQSFEDDLSAVLAEQYTELADVRRAEGEHTEAIELYTAALEHVEDHVPALSGREKSYFHAGESEKSKQDRDRLRELE